MDYNNSLSEKLEENSSPKILKNNIPVRLLAEDCTLMEMTSRSFQENVICFEHGNPPIIHRFWTLVLYNLEKHFLHPRMC